MSACTILTLANGKGIDLRHPTPADYADWNWQAEHLAKEKRYNGATPDVEYSVAEHAARGAKAILTAGAPRIVAACFLIHDNPEAALKDDTTPKKRTYAEEMEEQFGIGADKVLAVYRGVEARHEAAVHAAAGLPWPMSADVAAQVKHWDLVMFVTEWRDLMGSIEHPNWAPYAEIEPIAERIEPWDWYTAKRSWLFCAQHLLPALGGSIE